MITIKEVEHVAKLARLSLTEEEKTRFSEQIGNILDYFNQLKEVNTGNVKPMAQAIPTTNIMREDKVCEAFNRNDILANAPEEENGYFKVPRIIEE